MTSFLNLWAKPVLGNQNCKILIISMPQITQNCISNDYHIQLVCGFEYVLFFFAVVVVWIYFSRQLKLIDGNISRFGFRVCACVWLCDYGVYDSGAVVAAAQIKIQTHNSRVEYLKRLEKREKYLSIWKFAMSSFICCMVCLMSPIKCGQRQAHTRRLSEKE